MSNKRIGIIMGSDSDLAVMSEAAQILDEFKVSYEIRVISAHRTPDVMMRYASEAKSNGLQVIIAGAGGSAHLPGMTASHTPLPVIAVPIKGTGSGHEALWSNIKMPAGVPLATMPENGAKNAALLAIEILALQDQTLAKKYADFRDKQHSKVQALDSQVSKDWRGHLKA